MESDRLIKSMVPEPRLWRMAMRIEDSALKVVIYSTIEDNSLIYRSIPLEYGTQGSASSHLRALEDAIYDNPLLLSDFDRVSCIIATKRFIIAPVDLATDADDCEAMIQRAFPESAADTTEITASATGTSNAVILMALDSQLGAFLRRTFISPRIYHHLSPLCRYFVATAGRGNAVKTFVYLRPDSLDLIVIDRGKLLAANTFSYRDINDALYYILAARRILGSEAEGGELHITGDKVARDAITPRLRDYIERVMPVIFPSQMFKAGRDAMAAPFDLIVLPLCE